MTLEQIYLILAIHFIFYWFQSRNIQDEKWHSNGKLLAHTAICTTPFMLMVLTFGLEIKDVIWYSILLFLCHFILELITSHVEQTFRMLRNEYARIITTGVTQAIHLFLYFGIFSYLIELSKYK